MLKRFSWAKILNKCKINIHKQISPLLEKLKEPQPDLGIGAGGDPIKQIDLTAESAITNTLLDNEASFTLISEESGIKKYGRKPEECYVTTDPIDGSTNLTRGIPFYASSIAVSAKPILNTVHAAMVTDLFHDVTYTAEKGKGAYCNDRRMTPSGSISLEEAVIGVDLNSYKTERIVSQLTSLIKRTKHLRHFGANALELCYVADGTTDAFIDIRGKLRTTDIAAAWLIIREADAKITTVDGKPLNVRLDPRQKVQFVAAGNQKMHKLILDLIGPRKEAK